MAIPSFPSTVIARAAAALYGLQLGSGTMASVLDTANQGAGVDALINDVYNRDYANISNANVAAMVVSNLGITGAGTADAITYVQNVLDTAPAGGEGAAIANAVALFSGLTADPVYGEAATAFNGRIASAVAYSQQPLSVDRAFNAGASISMTLGQDFLSGTPGNDVISARIFNNSNTLQSGDWADGGAGADRLEADMGVSQDFSVTPETVNVETIAIRGQSTADDSGDNNVAEPETVKIDAERIVGATRFESIGSRADVIIEDVRILPSQITKDITIAFVESDPGHVDYGVYFDQYSLKNQASTTSTIVLRSLDTYNTSLQGSPSLKDSTYGAFTFTYIQNGATKSVTLGANDAGVIKTGPGTVQDAVTLVELVAALQTEVDLKLGSGAATVSLGAQYTVPDPVTQKNVTGNEIVITTNAAGITIPATALQPATTGWSSSGVAPAISNFYTTFETGVTTATSLVTSKVILDDVGRGSTGGDLVIGGLSVGSTSSSLGVQRFEIEVRDNSKLESINSTNNTLREVTVVNGVTTSTSHAYVPTLTNAGNLTVNGSSGGNGANVSGSSNRVPVTANLADTAPDANALPGVQSTTQGSGAIQTFGFTDVRLIDASTMVGKLEFTAQITSASLAKYLNTRDIQALPAGDNIAFNYTGGTVDDTMWVRLDSNFASSRNTIMVGREDFTFNMSGGTGNDWLNVAVTPTPGQVQHWYTNQSLNQNITLDGGAGNDVLRKPGAGDFFLLGGTGDDTIYADNSGSQAATTAVANNVAATFVANENAELAAAIDADMEDLATNETGDPGFVAPLQQPEVTLEALRVMDDAIPDTFAEADDLGLTRDDIETEILAALDAGALTPEQAVALIEAYNTSEDPEVSDPVADDVADAISPDADDIDPGTANGDALDSADLNRGNNLLADFIADAEDAVAEADAAEEEADARYDELTVEQQDVVDAHVAVFGNASDDGNDVNGTAVILAGLEDLRDNLEEGADEDEAIEALATAVIDGIIDAGTLAALIAAGAEDGVDDNDEEFDIQTILNPLIAAAEVADDDAREALADAIEANDTATRTLGADFANSDGVGADVGIADAVARAQAEENDAEDASDAADEDLADAEEVASDLAALEAALDEGTSELEVVTLLAAAVAAGTIDGITQGDILTAANIADPTNLDIDGELDEDEVRDIRDLFLPLQRAAGDEVRELAEVADRYQQIEDEAEDAEILMLSAAVSAGPGGTAQSNPRAVWVLNTADQRDVTLVAGSGYVLATNDERAVGDLKSDTNESYNFFGATVTVTFKDLVATATIPNTGYRTSDLQVNQAIKDAINNNAVLNKLITAADGPGNTLTITSQIDGVMSVANLSVAVTLPVVTAIAAADITAAATAYGVTATGDSVLAVMTAAHTTFVTNGDYVDQLAETGAFAGNALVRGAASITTSDNTITPGANNDVTVLGTTSSVTELLSSNDTVVFGAAFGNDTIVHFRAGALATGGDILDLTALGGSVLSTAFNVDESISVVTESTANDTGVEIAALFADSTSGQTHVYIAVDILTNIGKVYQVVDAAGTGAGSVTATLAGTIDLADTLWSTLTTDNFA